MARNFRRSSRGRSSLRASLRTRWLNSSQESSRLMKSAAERLAFLDDELEAEELLEEIAL